MPLRSSLQNCRSGSLNAILSAERLNISFNRCAYIQRAKLRVGFDMTSSELPAQAGLASPASAAVASNANESKSDAAPAPAPAAPAPAVVSSGPDAKSDDLDQRQALKKRLQSLAHFVPDFRWSEAFTTQFKHLYAMRHVLDRVGGALAVHASAKSCRALQMSKQLLRKAMASAKDPSTSRRSLAKSIASSVRAFLRTALTVLL